jgi:hypothetical protein
MTLAKPDFSNLPKFEKNFYLVSCCAFLGSFCCSFVSNCSIS